MLAPRKGKGSASTISFTRSWPKVHSQWLVIPSTPSAFMTLTMSWPLVLSEVIDPCQVSPPSSRIESGRAARIALTTVATRSMPPIRR